MTENIKKLEGLTVDILNGLDIMLNELLSLETPDNSREIAALLKLSKSINLKAQSTQEVIEERRTLLAKIRYIKEMYNEKY